MTQKQRISTFLDTLFEKEMHEGQQSVILASDMSMGGGDGTNSGVDKCSNNCTNKGAVTCKLPNSVCHNYGECGGINTSSCLNEPDLNYSEKICPGDTDALCVTNQTKCPTTNIKIVCWCWHAASEEYTSVLRWRYGYRTRRSVGTCLRYVNMAHWLSIEHWRHVPEIIFSNTLPTTTHRPVLITLLSAGVMKTQELPLNFKNWEVISVPR